MSIKKSQVARNRSCLETAEAWGIFVQNLEVFHGNLVHNSKKAPQKDKVRTRKSTTKAAAFLSKSRLSDSHFFFCLFPHLLYSFLLPEDLLFFWGSMHKVIRAQTSNTLFRHLSKTTQVSEFLFWIPTREHLWQAWLTMSGLVHGCAQGPRFYDSLASNSATSVGARTLEGKQAVRMGCRWRHLSLDGQKTRIHLLGLPSQTGWLK